MAGKITIAGVLRQSVRLARRHGRVLVPVAVAGMALKRAIVWAVFDASHVLHYELPRLYPYWSLEGMLRGIANGILDLTTRALLIVILLAAIRNTPTGWRDMGRQIAHSLIALAVVSLVFIALWEPVNLLTSLWTVFGARHDAPLAAAAGAIAWGAAYVVLSVRWWLAVPAILAEDVGPLAALSRSWSLTSGNAMRIFAIDALIALSTRAPVVALVLFGGEPLVPARSPFTAYNAIQFLLSVAATVALAASMSVVYAARAGVGDESIPDTFS